MVSITCKLQFSRALREEFRKLELLAGVTIIPLLIEEFLFPKKSAAASSKEAESPAKDTKSTKKA
ncbi:hypothetical protein C5167_030381 [Papaver somniferum]|nr:hypothetical protein C5167_030381 [Papaver somniferum]